MRSFAITLCACLALWSSQALAQTTPAAAKREVRVNVNISMSQAVGADEKASVTELQTTARKTIYELAGNECKLLLATLAGDCRLDSLNVNSNVQNRSFRGDNSNIFLTTNSNASFRIHLKD